MYMYLSNRTLCILGEDTIEKKLEIINGPKCKIAHFLQHILNAVQVLLLYTYTYSGTCFQSHIGTTKVSGLTRCLLYSCRR